jgi:hypothetical protein
MSSYLFNDKTAEKKYIMIFMIPGLSCSFAVSGSRRNGWMMELYCTRIRALMKLGDDCSLLEVAGYGSNAGVDANASHERNDEVDDDDDLA